MTVIRDLLVSKGNNVYTAKPDDPIRTALQLMADKGIGALPIMEQDKLVGIFSERDFARMAVKEPDCLNLEMPVAELMNTPVYFIEPEQSIEDCMAVMTAKRLRHLPVIEDGRLTGMISIGDVVKFMLADRQEKIDILEHFLWVNLI